MIRYFGDIASVETLMPTYLAKWLEEKSKDLKVTPDKLLKTILLTHYKRVKK